VAYLTVFIDFTALSMAACHVYLLLSAAHADGYPAAGGMSYKFVTEFWKITHIGTPETIRILEFSMALLIAEATFKNISKLNL